MSNWEETKVVWTYRGQTNKVDLSNIMYKSQKRSQMKSCPTLTINSHKEENLWISNVLIRKITKEKFKLLSLYNLLLMYNTILYLPLEPIYPRCNWKHRLTRHDRNAKWWLLADERNHRVKKDTEIKQGEQGHGRCHVREVSIGQFEAFT